MGRIVTGRRSWGRFALAVASSVAAVGFAASPASGIAPRLLPMTTGTGSATVRPDTVILPAPTSLLLTYTASSPLTAGVVTVTVPNGSTAPTAMNTTASTGTVSDAGSTITVSHVTLGAGGTLRIYYGTAANKVELGAKAGALGGYSAITVAMSPTSGTAPVDLAASPYVYLYEKAPPALFKEVTTVPLAVFNRIGVASSTPIYFPTVMRHQPPYEAVVHGKKVPAGFLESGEFCPYCATTQWGAILALSRFGHFTQLYGMTSSPDDFAPNTQSFTFYMTRYSSTYLAFTGYESEGPFHEALMALPRSVRALLNKYDSGGGIPFMDVGNLTFTNGTSFDPQLLAGHGQFEIAGHLRTTTSGVTRAIVATANYMTASICASDGEVPASVCKSAGVIKADAKMGLERG